MLKANYFKHTLNFKRPSGTSRGVLKTKDSWFIRLFDDANPEIVGIGECSLIAGLSPDSNGSFHLILKEICDSIHLLDESKIDFGLNLLKWPSISFGLYIALQDLKANGSKILSENSFVEGKPIPINGLVWMGEKNFMKKQIIEKIDTGFSCIKLKIGAIDFAEEVDLLKYIRSEFGNKLELRVDANGAFQMNDALEKLNRLSEFSIHSIEQPIKQGQWTEMADLCTLTPIPIALDEELIGSYTIEAKKTLLKTIKPHYIILKPSLHGGFVGANEWIELAEVENIKWWATSALESNIGLSAIAQWVSGKNNGLPQGLGTGSLYTNNISSPLVVSNGTIMHCKDRDWDLTLFD